MDAKLFLGSGECAFDLIEARSRLGSARGSDKLYVVRFRLDEEPFRLAAWCEKPRHPIPSL